MSLGMPEPADDENFEQELAASINHLRSGEPALDELDSRHRDGHVYSHALKAVRRVNDEYEWSRPASGVPSKSSGDPD